MQEPNHIGFTFPGHKNYLPEEWFHHKIEVWIYLSRQKIWRRIAKREKIQEKLTEKFTRKYELDLFKF